MTVPSKAKIFEYWMDWLDKKGFDWGEHSCWACGKHWEDEYDIKNSDASRKGIIQNWERVQPLQRCHIIPKQFNGSDDPSNLFLMCMDCHDKAPNTPSRNTFMLWVDNQNWYKNLQDEFNQELDTFGLQNRIDEMSELLKDEKAKKEIFENIGIHMNQQGKGLKITTSTYIAAIYEHLKEKDRISNA